MLLLKRKSFEIEAGSPIVTGEEAGVVAQAADIVAAAEAEAARIIETAKEAFESEKNRGYVEGLAAARQDELEKKLGLVDDAVTYMEKIEGRMGDLVVKAMKKCVAEIGDKELVVQIVRKSMQAIVRAQRQVKIKVAPEMVETVKERLSNILEQFPSVAFAEVVEDSHLTGTGCVVETDAGSVEASIDGQLAAIEKSVRRSFSREERG